MEFTKIFNQALSHKATLDNMQKDLDDNIAKIIKSKNEVTLLGNILNSTANAHLYLETLIKEESSKFIKRYRDILDHAVKTIFYDEEYSIDIRSNEDNTTIHLLSTDLEGNKISPDIKYCGGGIKTVVGAVSQIFFIFHYKAEPIMFIDEGFSQLSTQYIPYFMGLIEEMASKNHLKILLITHDPRMMSYADKTYEVIGGKTILKKNRNNTAGVIPVVLGSEVSDEPE